MTEATGPNLFVCSTIQQAVDKLADGPLTEAGLREHIWPLFSRVRQRNSRPDSSRQIYLANHSLGRPLDQTAIDVQEAMDLWYDHLDAAWTAPHGWLAAIQNFRTRIAQLIGAASYQQVVPKTSAGQGLRAVLNSLSDHGHVPTILTTRAEFDSCDVILKTYAAKGRAAVRWVEPSRQQGIDQYSVDDLITALNSQVDLVLCSQVLFATGQVLEDLPRLVEAAHQCGALVIVDTYHSAGVLPLVWEGASRYSLGGADFLIGGSYKYARGGPGACWLAIHSRHLHGARLSTLDTGWFAKHEPFSYQRPDPPQFAESGDGWLESTPPVLTAYQARAGLQLLLTIGVARLREYNLQQQQQLVATFQHEGLELFQPSDLGTRGAFALFPHPQASQLCEALISHGIHTDARGGCVRFGPDILTAADEFSQAAKALRKLLTA